MKYFRLVAVPSEAR